jgi:hypothetical protein
MHGGRGGHGEHGDGRTGATCVGFAAPRALAGSRVLLGSTQWLCKHDFDSVTGLRRELSTIKLLDSCSRYFWSGVVDVAETLKLNQRNIIVSSTLNACPMACVKQRGLITKQLDSLIGTIIMTYFRSAGGSIFLKITVLHTREASEQSLKQVFADTLQSSQSDTKRQILQIDQLLINYQSDTNQLLINYQSDTNQLLINYQLDTNQMLINYQSDTNELLINYQSDTNHMLIKYQSDANCST